MKQLAHVVEVKGDRVSLLVRRAAGCKQCGQSDQCATGQANQMLQGDGELIQLRSSVPVKAGEPVMLVMPDTLYRNLALVAYGLPLAGFLAGAVAGTWLALRQGWPVDLLAFVTGVAAGWLGLRFGRWWTERSPRAREPFHIEKLHPDF